MAIKEKRLEKIIDVIERLVSIPTMDAYVVGLTGQTLEERAAQYYRIGFHGVAMIANGLTGKEATELEGRIHDYIDQADKRSRISAKYHPEKDTSVRRPSVGGKDRGPAFKGYGIYIAWFDRES